MNYAARTNIGRRAQNQDGFLIPGEKASVPFLAVADGMGGHAAGQVASKLVLDGMAGELSRLYDEDPILTLRRAISRVNMEVYRSGADDPSLSGMGSTLVCALLFETHFIAANVGDSRLYHFDGKELTQVTIDHSLVEMLVRGGHITREEALTHPQRNLITRAMGLGLRVEPDVFDRTWQKGDLLLLCSDGLSGSVRPERIAELLRAGADALNTLAGTLVTEALESGATDNITVALARCTGGDCA